MKAIHHIKYVDDEFFKN